MARTATVKKVKNGWKVYVYDTKTPDPGMKSISRRYKTRAEALKAAKQQRKTAMKKWLRSSD